MYQLAVKRQGVEAALLTQPAVPVVANCYMAYFVAQDDVEQFNRFQRSGRSSFSQLGLNQGRGIESACFQGAGNQRHAGQNIVRCFLAHVPKAIMRIKVAVLVA